MTAEPAIEFEDGQQSVDRFVWEGIVRRVSMPSGAKYLALMLATFSDSDGSRIYPGIGLLGRTMEVSERTVIRNLGWLRDNGFVTRSKKGNRHLSMSDEYQLTVPPDVLDRLVLDPDGAESK
ncbi:MULTISPECIES: helix-turn-helix domain-containing protein [Rhodococcus]|uniref:helix-turn-helix domain-containing protein n=1 Tax=Rhodococcus TaxID=1827 RepID=UPI0007DB0F64|nr:MULTISPECIES: helix-turn-helix domain-containing protein [Rhodococcus]MBQ9051722.1 hypothetical protein [Rhodococcus sp. (in: high G+C Gram-positive bacteria)]BCF84556.1 hypothetical protein RQCS_41010 [Rhodococcus qingshengii]